MPVKVTIDRNWSNKIQSGIQKGLLEMVTEIDKRSAFLAPKDTRALVNSRRITPQGSDAYLISYGADGKVPYARRRHEENNKNPQSRGYLAKAGDSVARGEKSKYFKNKV